MSRTPKRKRPRSNQEIVRAHFRGLPKSERDRVRRSTNKNSVRFKDKIPGIRSAFNELTKAMSFPDFGSFVPNGIGQDAEIRQLADHFRTQNGIPPNTLRRAFRDGRLSAEKVGGRWFYLPSEVKRLWPDAFGDR